jgi:hypothetical protein
MYIYMLLIFAVVLLCLSFYLPREAFINPFEDEEDACIIKLKYTPFISSTVGYSNENNALQKNYESILEMADYNQYKRMLDPSCRFD